MKPLILASQSPRRKQLLEQVQLPFSIQVSHVDETVDPNDNPADMVASLAFQKADAVFKNNKDHVVLGADTIVAIDGEVLGKPKDAQEAKEMLRQLSGSQHQVLTGVAILSKDHHVTFVEKADVLFYPLTEDEITTYVATGEPFDKAGAYGIQGIGATLVEKIHGDYFSIVGLPISKVVRALKKFHITTDHSQ
ncbi:MULTISPECIES: Maf family protein [Bacillaceae]|uniref:dTTP/UTP pyrophosphatase n=1 Tax=Evansella alkalicola TaxID=745819 RepID=A0ABS6JUX4_9BACI|nr:MULTISPECIES: Maf family protein [Bacillaceae]MBU9721906.1 Maf family protein [Bacillus alkalicola]